MPHLETFIFSGYPHLEEAYRVTELLFPHLPLDYQPPSLETNMMSPFVGEIIGNDRHPSSQKITTPTAS